MKTLPSHVRYITALGIFICVMALLAAMPGATYAATNLVPNSSVETAGTGGLPLSWKKGGFGTNTRSLTYPVAGYQSTKAVRVDVTSYTSGDAKWYFTNVNVGAGVPMEWSNAYRSNTTSYVTVQFVLGNGTTKYQDLGVLPSSGSAWKAFSKTFTTPPGTVSVTVFHLIKSVGFLETDAFNLNVISADPTKFDKGYVSINFDDGNIDTYHNAFPILNAAGYKADAFIITNRLKPNDFPGYVKAQDVLDMQNAGHEIGAHTRSHPDLTTLSQSDAVTEIQGSRNDLLAIGAKPVSFFAYPYGAYNSSVITDVKNAGFLAARTSDGGYNQKMQDKFTLRRQPMVNTTTFAQIKSYIDTARTDKEWVILLFHQVDNTGDQYAVTPALFQQTVDYLKQLNMPPIKMSQGVALMNQ